MSIRYRGPDGRFRDSHADKRVNKAAENQRAAERQLAHQQDLAAIQAELGVTPAEAARIYDERKRARE